MRRHGCNGKLARARPNESAAVGNKFGAKKRFFDGRKRDALFFDFNDAVGATGVIICNRRTDVFNPNVIRASTGAIFSVPLAETSSEEAVEWFRSHNIRTVAASPHSTQVYTDLDMTQGIALVVGAEQYGLTDYWMKGADINVQIPMLGRMDSLNVATAATILLYEAARQRKWKPSCA